MVKHPISGDKKHFTPGDFIDNNYLLHALNPDKVKSEMGYKIGGNGTFILIIDLIITNAQYIYRNKIIY